MATGGIGVPLKDIERILQCSICLEIFKNPRTLLCSHTFCNDCLENTVPMIYHDGQGGIKCPLCQKFHKAGEYINSFLVKQFMELYIRCTERVTHCYCCNDKEAQWRCLDCKFNMCAPCQYVHSKTPMSEQHKYQTFTVEASLTLDENFDCECHKGQKLELHCVECQSLICMMCRATRHSNHNCETVDEGCKRLKEKADDILKSLAQGLIQCDEQEKFLEYHHDLMQEEYERVKAKYQVERENLITAIEKQEQKELERIEKYAVENHDRIKEVADQNKAQIQVKQRLLNTSTTALSRAKGCILLKILTGGLMNRLEQEEMKVVNYALVAITIPVINSSTAFEEEFVFLNPPSFLNYTRSFQLNTSAVRSFNMKFTDVMSAVDETNVEVKLQGKPFRMSFVDNTLWIPSNREGAGDYEVFNICDRTTTQKSCDALRCVYGFCQAANSDVIAACHNGLYSLNTNGEVKYKITDGVFSDVHTNGENLVAVECNICQVQVFKLTSNKWRKWFEFTVKDPNHRLKSIHVNHNSVYVCYHWTDKIYRYSLQGDYIEEYGSIQGKALGEFHAPLVNGTDCLDSLIVCDARNYRIQVRSSQGEWQQYKLEGIAKTRDVLVVEGRLFVMWAASSVSKLTVYKVNLFK